MTCLLRRPSAYKSRIPHQDAPRRLAPFSQLPFHSPFTSSNMKESSANTLDFALQANHNDVSGRVSHGIASLQMYEIGLS